MYVRVLIFKRGQPGILLCTTFVCTIHYEDIHVHTLAIIHSKCNHLVQCFLFTVRTRDILSNIGGGLWSFGTKQLAVTSAMVALVKTKSLLFNFTKMVTKTVTKKKTNKENVPERIEIIFDTMKITKNLPIMNKTSHIDTFRYTKHLGC